MLTDVSHQRGCLEFAFVRTDRYLIKHMFILRDETINATTRKRKTYNQAKARKYYPTKAIHSTKVGIIW
jgi:hypothetical protein